MRFKAFIVARDNEGYLTAPLHLHRPNRPMFSSLIQNTHVFFNIGEAHQEARQLDNARVHPVDVIEMIGIFRKRGMSTLSIAGRLGISTQNVERYEPQAV